MTFFGKTIPNLACLLVPMLLHASTYASTLYSLDFCRALLRGMTSKWNDWLDVIGSQERLSYARWWGFTKRKLSLFLNISTCLFKTCNPLYLCKGDLGRCVIGGEGKPWHVSTIHDVMIAWNFPRKEKGKDYVFFMLFAWLYTSTNSYGFDRWKGE